MLTPERVRRGLVPEDRAILLLGRKEIIIMRH